MPELRNVLEQAAAEEAETFLASRGEKPTYTKIAALTAVPRRRIRSLLSAEEISGAHIGARRPTRVIIGWQQDGEFLESDGTPADLPVTGPAPSFQALVLRYAGAVAVAPLLKSLVDARDVVVLEADSNGLASRVRLTHANTRSELQFSGAFGEYGDICHDALEHLEASAAGGTHVDAIRPFTSTATVIAPHLRVIRRQLQERGEAMQSLIGTVLQQHDLPADEVAEISEADPRSLYSVRVTVVSTIQPALPGVPERVRAWRRPNVQG